MAATANHTRLMIDQSCQWPSLAQPRKISLYCRSCSGQMT
jgi:hypothetical protein